MPASFRTGYAISSRASVQEPPAAWGRYCGGHKLDSTRSVFDHRHPFRPIGQASGPVSSDNVERIPVKVGERLDITFGVGGRHAGSSLRFCLSPRTATPNTPRRFAHRRELDDFRGQAGPAKPRLLAVDPDRQVVVMAVGGLTYDQGAGHAALPTH